MELISQISETNGALLDQAETKVSEAQATAAHGSAYILEELNARIKE